MKKIVYLLAIFCILLTVSSCSDMDENYRDYLDNIPTYSPAVRNLTAESPEAGSLTLRWEIVDDTNLIKGIRILAKKTSEDIETYNIDQVVTEYTVTGLELQGYEFYVYTVDGFGNLSIPIIETSTPIPGRE